MVEIGPGSRVDIRRKYPHLAGEDRELWVRWINLGRGLPQEVWYDVRVGGAMPVDRDDPDWLHKWALASSRKRIDVVMRYGGDYVVVEVKPRASMMCLGQCIVYRWAFDVEYETGGHVRAAVLTDVCDEDVRPVFAALGIAVIEVG